MKKIAVIGAGNMGGAIAESLRGSGYALTVTAATGKTLRRVAETCPEAVCTTSNREAVADADIVILCVKPYVAPGVISEILPVIKPETVVASVVAALPVDEVARLFKASDTGVKAFRVIPNTAIRLGKSVTFISSEIDEMLNVCSRLIVMRDRKTAGELTGSDLNQSKIMETIAGGEKVHENA